MSLPTNTDLTEEDAADLQFPKGRCSSLNSEFANFQVNQMCFQKPNHLLQLAVHLIINVTTNAAIVILIYPIGIFYVRSATRHFVSIVSPTAPKCATTKTIIPIK